MPKIIVLFAVFFFSQALTRNVIGYYPQWVINSLPLDEIEFDVVAPKVDILTHAISESIQHKVFLDELVVLQVDLVQLLGHRGAFQHLDDSFIAQSISTKVDLFKIRQLED